MGKQILASLQMNTIRVLTSFICLIFIFSCNFEQAKSTTMVLSFSDAWKKDTLACAGTRERITRDSLNIIEKCEGISERDFISLFGQPNAIKYYRSHKNYYYWASCIIMPESKGFPEEINENARQLIVRIDSLSMIEQIILAVP